MTLAGPAIPASTDTYPSQLLPCPTMRIQVDDLSGPEVIELLEEHLRNMYEWSPPESVQRSPNGQLRPPRDQAPELYHETPIGLIPKEWHYELLDKLATRGSGHTPSKSNPEYWNGGIKWLSLADSSKLDRLYVSDTSFEISEKGVQNSSAVLHPPGIVVLSRDAGIGKSAITASPMAVSQHFMCWNGGPS